MKLVDSASIFYKNLRVQPFKVRRCVFFSPDLKKGETATVESSAFEIVPYTKEYTFNRDLELKHIYIKPPRFMITPAFTMAKKDDEDAWEPFVNKYYVRRFGSQEETLVKETNVKGFVLNSSEVVCWFRASIGTNSITGYDGILLSSKNRIIDYSLEDVDEKGLLVKAGERLKFEIVLFDVSALMSLKTILMQSCNHPSYGDSSLSDLYAGVKSDDPLTFRLGLTYVGSPTFLLLADKLNEKFKESLVISEQDLSYNIVNSSSIEEIGIGYEVDVLLSGFYLGNKLCSL